MLGSAPCSCKSAFARSHAFFFPQSDAHSCNKRISSNFSLGLAPPFRRTSTISRSRRAAACCNGVHPIKAKRPRTMSALHTSVVAPSARIRRLAQWEHVSPRSRWQSPPSLATSVFKRWGGLIQPWTCRILFILSRHLRYRWSTVLWLFSLPEDLVVLSPCEQCVACDSVVVDLSPVFQE